MRPCFAYLCAGGDAALFMSKEAPEDNWAAGRALFREKLTGMDDVLLVGISCGLSAPFVAGQFDYANVKLGHTTSLQHVSFHVIRFLRHPCCLAPSLSCCAAGIPLASCNLMETANLLGAVTYAAFCSASCPISISTMCYQITSRATPRKLLSSILPRLMPLLFSATNTHSFGQVVVGFNPLAMARDVPIEGWHKTFAQSLGHPSATILPVVGPEAITGSTRMKGGSATKILLEVAFGAALERNISSVGRYIFAYEACVRNVYKNTSGIAKLIALGGTVLKAGGRICYLGEGTVGILALVDASECPPTYNATADDVRAWLDGGYDTLRNVEGDLSERGPEYHLSWAQFQAHTLPELGERDAIIVIDGPFAMPAEQQRRLQDVCTAARTQGAAVACVHVQQEDRQLPLVGGIAWDEALVISLPDLGFMSAATSADSCPYGELAVKLVLNAITTGAHIIKGKVRKHLRACCCPRAEPGFGGG